MSPDTLRFLDRFLGLPLCHALTLWRVVRDVFSPPVGAFLPCRTLFVQLAEAGSMVLAAPALKASERLGARAYFVTFASNAPALALLGCVSPERVFTLRDDSFLHLCTDVWRLRGWVRQQAIEAAIDMELFSRLTAVLTFWAGTRRRAGFHDELDRKLYRGRLFSAPVRFDPHIHMARNYLRLASALFDTDLDAEPLAIDRIQPAATSQSRVDALLKSMLAHPIPRLVLINPNASERLPQRRWPAAYYSALVEQLLAVRPDVTVLLIGADSDRATTARIARQVGMSRCVDIAGRVALEDLPALFEHASLMVSNDSGPAHFSAVSDLPVVVLFGPETPVLFAPLGPATILDAALPCSPCVSPANQRKSDCADNRCMQGIAVAEVLAASLYWLARDRTRFRSAAAMACV